MLTKAIASFLQQKIWCILGIDREDHLLRPSSLSWYKTGFDSQDNPANHLNDSTQTPGAPKSAEADENSTKEWPASCKATRQNHAPKTVVKNTEEQKLGKLHSFL